MSNTHQPRVLIVGAGSIGERHLRCFQALGLCNVGVVEVNESLRKTIAERYHATAFADLESALATQPDAAVVATPAHLHIAIAQRLAEAGVHSLIEKPLSVNLKGIDQLRSVVKDRALTTAVAYVYRCFAGLAAMREAVVSGRFGQPVQIVAVGGQHFPTYRPAYRDTYYATRATGGGAVQDALTHILNAGEWLVGPIDSVVADAAHQVLEGVDVEDTVQVLARHGEVLGSYSLNQHQAPNELSITVICRSGTARWLSTEPVWRWQVEPDTPWHCEPVEPQARDAAFTEQARRFISAIAGEAVAPCSLDEGVQTLRVNLAVLQSVETRQWQKTLA